MRERERFFSRNLLSSHEIVERESGFTGVGLWLQAAPEVFNKAAMMNVAFTEVSKRYDIDCFVFHDVDMLLENDHNIYQCGNRPRHLATQIDKFDYR